MPYRLNFITHFQVCTNYDTLPVNGGECFIPPCLYAPQALVVIYSRTVCDVNIESEGWLAVVIISKC